MSDLIKRINAIRNLPIREDVIKYKMICELIDKEGSQFEEKTGKWIYDDEAYPYGNPCGHYDCDQCGESMLHKTNYCPNCGAKMEAE